MYVGRIVAVGATKSGRPCAMYRVSSRSFPNRDAVVLDGAVGILPKKGHENDIHRNPYIAYNCLKLVGRYAVVTNGSHTDPIACKLGDGVNMRDAMVGVLHGMDFEHDQLDTPRIAAIVDQSNGQACLGIVTRQSLLVRGLTLEPGVAQYVATYEHTVPGTHADLDFDVSDAEDACTCIMGARGVFAALERPIAAACAVGDAGGDGYEIAIDNGAAG